MLEKTVELLEQLPVFQGLSHQQLKAISDCGTKAFFQTGETIIAEGLPGDTAYVILTGKAGCPVREGDDIFEEDLWPGTLIGELAMLVETVHPVTVTAKERVRALAISRGDFHAVMQADPSIAQHISEKLLVRLYGLAEQLRKVDEQLAAIEEAA